MSHRATKNKNKARAKRRRDQTHVLAIKFRDLLNKVNQMLLITFGQHDLRKILTHMRSLKKYMISAK